MTQLPPRQNAERNIALFQSLLGEEADEAKRKALARMLADAERDFAVASVEGKQHPLAQADSRALTDGQLCLLLDPGPGLRIIDASQAYAAAVLTRRRALLGRALFELFRPSPFRVSLEDVADLYASLRTVAATGRPHALPATTYDVRDWRGGFVQRRWRTTGSAVQDEAGRVVALLHQVIEDE